MMSVTLPRMGSASELSVFVQINYCSGVWPARMDLSTLPTKSSPMRNVYPMCEIVSTFSQNLLRAQTNHLSVFCSTIALHECGPKVSDGTNDMVLECPCFSLHLLLKQLVLGVFQFLFHF